MLHGQGFSQFLWTYDNWGANPSTTLGTSVTPGASNAEGSATVIATGANIATDVYWVLIKVYNGNTSGQSKPHLLDIGADLAGGTSYTWLMSNLVCGASAGIGSNALTFLMPLYIKAGSQVAVRVQGGNATAGTLRVTAKFYGRPSRPEALPVAGISETIGAITNSDGVSFTPGNASDGTWVSLGTTTYPLWWWLLGSQISGVMTSGQVYIDLAFGDATNKHIIKRAMQSVVSTETLAEMMQTNVCFTECYCPVPAGSELFVRGRCSGAPDTGYNAVAVGFGG